MTMPPITVLLVEDDEEDVILLQRVLAKIQHAHYHVLWEQGFESGLAHMAQCDHDITLLDYRLGTHSGIELLKEARRTGYALPIIMLTGLGGADIDILALQAGADDYITKDMLQGELLHRLIRYAIERRKAEQEREILMREQIMRDARDAKRNEFISMVVHELKTPLSSIKGYAQLLDRRFRRAGDEQSARMVARMDSQAERLNTLVNDLLDVSRIEGGKLQLRESLFDFDALVRDVIESVQLTTERQTIDQIGETQKMLWGDRERIGQVITNLLTNAIKYAPLTDKILVILHADAQEVKVCVQDFGPGIPKTLQQSVFEAFYRIEGSGGEFVSGLGLGLAIVADLVKRHHGRVWVESEEGRGAIFCFTLPIDHRELADG